MPKRNAAAKFSADGLKSISRSLSGPVNERRLELLPRILREWSRTDLQNHLSMRSRAAIQADIDKIEHVTKYADKLLRALDEISKFGRTAIKQHIIRLGGRSLNDVSLDEFKCLLEAPRDFLAKLTVIKPRQIWKLKAWATTQRHSISHTERHCCNLRMDDKYRSNPTY